MNIMGFSRRGAALSPQPANAAGSGAFAPTDADTGPSLLNYILTILIRRKWVILGTITAFLFVSLVVTLLLTPKYTAASTIEIQRETGNFAEVHGAEESRGAVDQEFYQTQYGLLVARSLAERVATNLRLIDDRHFFEMFGASAAAAEWFEGGRAQPSASSRQQRISTAAGILLRHVEIRPERFSRLVGVRFTSPDPLLSKRVVDAWGANFVQLTLDRRFEATAYARRFLEQRLAQLRSRIDESERRLVDYAGREGIINLPAAAPAPGQASAGGGERSLAADDLVSTNAELAEAVARRVEAQSRLNARPGEVTEALNNPAIATLRQRHAELAADYARMMSQFEPQYPPAIALQNQIQQLDRSITREETRVQGTLRETYEASVAREAALRQNVDQLKSNVLDLRRRSIQYNIFQRDTDTSRQLYDALLQRYKEIGIAGGVGVNNISIVDIAEVPSAPSSPSLPLNMAVALILGFALGAGVALGLEQLHQGITDPTEVETGLGVPLLGTIPKVADGHPAEALEDRKSAVSEAYHSLQTSLSFTTDHGIPRTVAVTSTRAAEGKTTTAYALARSIARTKGKVLLVDADMRAPSIHHLFDLPNENGLSNYLAGDGDLRTLIRETPHDRLFVMTAGPQPPSAPDLLSSERLAKLIAELGADFAHVVFDAPPVMGLADAPLVGSMVEGTVFVMEANSTQKSMAKVALGRLANSSAQILGVVLTKFDPRKAHYGYGYDYGYGYGYGETAKKAS
jgi:succinoglycan biosynthesis transport protein ExoP